MMGPRRATRQLGLEGATITQDRSGALSQGVKVPMSGQEGPGANGPGAAGHAAGGLWLSGECFGRGGRRVEGERGMLRASNISDFGIGNLFLHHDPLGLIPPAWS